MCDELPNRKETVLVFIRYIGNKDTSAVYPKSMRVNRRNVIEALLWLKKHNPHYKDVTIKESNLDWMKDKDEANIGQEGEILSTKDTQCYKVLSTEEDMVANAHGRMDLSGCADNECDIEIGAMHPNVGNTLPNSDNVELIQSFINIAKKTGQSSKVMDFPPIDHDNPIKRVLLFHVHYIYMRKMLQSSHLNTVNTTIQNRYLSTLIHGCFLVELGIYKIWNKGRYLLKNGVNIY